MICLGALTLEHQRSDDVRELAAVTGESVTLAVRKAAEERLQRVRRGNAGRRLAADLLEIVARCAALPDQDSRSVDEILDYDEHGVPRGW